MLFCQMLNARSYACRAAPGKTLARGNPGELAGGFGVAYALGIHAHTPPGQYQHRHRAELVKRIQEGHPQGAFWPVARRMFNGRPVGGPGESPRPWGAHGWCRLMSLLASGGCLRSPSFFAYGGMPRSLLKRRVHAS